MDRILQVAPQTAIRRYSNVTVAFHWTTVILVLTQAYLGFAFHSMERGPVRTELFLWHQTIGALILIITLARLGYRLANPPPHYPSDLARWEQIASTWNQRIFYFLLIALPLTGLTAVSAHVKGATTALAGGIPLPVIPGVSEAVGEIAGGVHIILVLLLILAILIHVSAALKHQFFDHAPAAGRMPPFRAPAGTQIVIGQGKRAQ